VIHSFAGGGDYDEAVPLFSNHWKIEKRFGIPNARLEEGNKGEFFRGLEWVHLFIGHRCRALECGGNQRATPLLQLHCSAAKSAVARWLPAHSKIFYCPPCAAEFAIFENYAATRCSETSG
jgi:hypothetical protein